MRKTSETPVSSAKKATPRQLSSSDSSRPTSGVARVLKRPAFPYGPPSSGSRRKPLVAKHQQMAKSPVPVETTPTFFSAVSTSPSSAQTLQGQNETNADYLKRINYQGDIPPNCCCKISGKIMTDPVRVNDHATCSLFKSIDDENTAYERNVVSAYIAQHRKHPLTGKGIGFGYSVECAENIKAEIDAFMAQVQQLSAPTLGY